ncbi:hypothetical protein FRB95_007755 [Tulasnella sp. JGI-2019a]|nr:hypothetical protein FRB95_007755 [Tulasnella sp. JGI-2019a]
MHPWSKIAGLFALASAVLALDGYVVPPGSPGYQHGNSTQHVQFDTKSLFVDGQRIFLYGGEFHFWRLPVPALWSDILQKFKAAGINAVSIYVHWGITEGKAGVRDWTEWRDLEAFLKVAAQVGIYVVARPGPYINAETTGGGLPGWLTNNPAVARSNDTRYIDAWEGYIRDFSQIVSKYQYPDGAVIAVQAENEFFTDWSGAPTTTEYMGILETAFRADGISKVPLIVNDVYPSGHFASPGPSAVDIYGFDSYPSGFDCSTTVWPELPDYYITQLAANAPNEPMWFPEFQGGALVGWGGTSKGYAGCYDLTGPDFVNVYYKNNVASGSKAMSFYMTYGGTNWGNLANPGVYTSYDYGAAIHESRAISDKFNELKLQGLFYQSSPSLYSTVIIGSGSSYTSDTSLFTTHLADNSTSTINYYIVRQGSQNTTTTVPFTLSVNTTAGAITIPQLGGTLALVGRESKIIVTGYTFGTSVVTYSTAEVLTHATFDGIDYIVLYATSGSTVEAVVKGPTSATPIVTGSSSIKATVKDSSVTLTGTPSHTIVRWGKTVVIVVDKPTAYTFWNPRTTNAYNLTPTTPSVIVSGPYLVRTAKISGSTLALVGDTNGTTTFNVYAPSAVTSVTWNGVSVKTTKSALGVGLTGSITTAVPTITLPTLSALPWKSTNSLPEIAASYDDRSWVVANKTNTSRPFTQIGEYVLYADEYGFHAGNFIYRGYFNGSATGLDLWYDGGSSGGYSAFVNGHFAGSGQSTNSNFNGTVTFPTGSVLAKGTNVITILSDSSGLEGDWNANDGFKEPRGIRGYTLLGGASGSDIYEWKMTGNLGGESYPDKVRGPINEGGLWVERAGATLPGYDYSSWTSSTPYTGISTAGVQAYHTKFTLNIPSGVDATIGVQFTATPTSNYRSLIFINGWQYGRFISNYGPQTVYPVPQGILNHNGSNDIVVTLWSLDATGAKIAGLELVTVQAVNTGLPKITGIVSSPGFSQLRK